jgi:hypothetical protein
MSKYDNQFRLGTAAALAVASVGGAAASSGAISQNIFNIQSNWLILARFHRPADVG